MLIRFATRGARRRSVAIAAVLVGVTSGSGAALAADSSLLDLATSAIEDADERLSSRLNAILEVLATSSNPAHPSAGHADLATDRAALGDRRLFELWSKTYGSYWNRPTSGDVAGGHGTNAGLALGAGLPLDRNWQIGAFGGFDHSVVDYSSGEEVDATAVFGGFDARFEGDSGVFAGVAVVGGYSWHNSEQPIEFSMFTFKERANYGAAFGALVGSVGKRVPMTEELALRFSATGSYGAESTEAYSYSLLAGDFTIDQALTQAVDGRLEVGIERKLDIGRGGLVEAFGGVLGHYQLGGEQDVEFGGAVFDILDPSVESVAGFVGVGVTSRIGFNWGLSGRGQAYYSSDGTAAIAGYVRALGIF
jgi:Autotransporter beta-domain